MRPKSITPDQLHLSKIKRTTASSSKVSRTMSILASPKIECDVPSPLDKSTRAESSVALDGGMVFVGAPNAPPPMPPNHLQRLQHLQKHQRRQILPIRRKHDMQLIRVSWDPERITQNTAFVTGAMANW